MVLAEEGEKIVENRLSIKEHKKEKKRKKIVEKMVRCTGFKK